MTLQPVYLLPGVCKVNSAYASGKQIGAGPGRYGTGRYTDMSGIRFVAGFPEKIGGWQQVAYGLGSRTNCAVDYRGSDSSNNLAIGATKAVFTFNPVNAFIWYEVTPFRYPKQFSSGGLTLTITANSSIISLTQPVGLWVSTVGWIYISVHDKQPGGIGYIKGWFKLTSGNPLVFDCGVVSSLSATQNLQDAVFYSEWNLLGSAPIATTSGSPLVVVTFSGHGAAVGDVVSFSGASAVGGLTLSGDYTITAVTSTTFTVNAGSNAGSTTSGGGTFVIVRFRATIPTISNAATSTVVNTFKGWTMAAYGSMVVCAPCGGQMFFLNSAYGGGHGYPITLPTDAYAPKSVLAIFVTPERFIVALGINGNSMQMAWCDQSDPTQWQSLPTNTANQGRTLQGGGFLVGGIPVGSGISLIFSNKSCFQMQYIGGNTVYSTPMLSDVAGLIGPGAVATLGGVAFWMSSNDFFAYTGTVQRLPSDDIRDYVFTTLGGNPGFNYEYAYNVACGSNRAKNEIWWFYPDASHTENNRYVIYHIDQQCWSVGLMSRTAWCDSHLFSTPYAFDAGGFGYIHEVGVDAAGSALDCYLTTSPIDISNGDAGMDVFGFIPDIERLSGNLALTIYTQQYTEDTPAADGPYTLAPGSPPRLDLRSDGKLLSFKLRSNAVGGDVRLGLCRVDIKPSNQRL
jgi:hypothetical protein